MNPSLEEQRAKEYTELLLSFAWEEAKLKNVKGIVVDSSESRFNFADKHMDFEIEFVDPSIGSTTPSQPQPLDKTSYLTALKKTGISPLSLQFNTDELAFIPTVLTERLAVGDRIPTQIMIVEEGIALVVSIASPEGLMPPRQRIEQLFSPLLR